MLQIQSDLFRSGVFVRVTASSQAKGTMSICVWNVVDLIPLACEDEIIGGFHPFPLTLILQGKDKVSRKKTRTKKQIFNR